MSYSNRVGIVGVGIDISYGVMAGRNFGKTIRKDISGEVSGSKCDFVTLDGMDAADAFDCLMQSAKKLSIATVLSTGEILQIAQRLEQLEVDSAIRSMSRLSIQGEILGNVGDTCCFGKHRIDSGCIMLREHIKFLRNDPHSSYYRLPYFSIFGSDRPLMEQRLTLPKNKVSKNVRPKGTHTHSRFYR